MHTTIITCLNGRFVRADRAAIALSDRGFRFGDGVFETIRLVGGVPYQWELHMARLLSGLAALKITPPEIHWPFYVASLIRKNKAVDGVLRIAVSRGVGSRGYLPHPPGMPATWAMEYLPPLDLPLAPYRLWLSSIARIPPQCLPTQYKLAQGMGSTLAALEAVENDCDDALQLTPDGLISEASSGNIFWVRDGQLNTPGLETGCLAGTTRDAVLRLSSIPVHVVADGISRLQGAEAVFLTNTRLGIFPVAEVQPMGWQFHPAHPVVRELQTRLMHDRSSYRWNP